MNSLGVYWWFPQGGHNLGDVLTSVVLDKIFEVEHHYARLETARLLGAGSILNWIWERPEVSARIAPLAVLGSGLMHPHFVASKLDFLRVYGVRGHLTLSALDRNAHSMVKIGDPGLLVSRVQHAAPSETFTYGVIPHFKQVERADLISRFSGLKSHKIIDFRTDNLADVLTQMRGCDFILSQSLHGLIIADALGIPNVWLNYGALHSGGAFKFYDYFSSVNRPFDKVLYPKDALSSHNIRSNSFELDRMSLYKIQENILAGFRNFFRDNNIDARLVL